MLSAPAASVAYLGQLYHRNTFVPVIEQFAGIVRVLGTPVTLNYKVDIVYR